MAENLPVRSTPVPATHGVDLIAVAQQADQIKALGQTLIASGMLPDSIKKPEAAMAIMIRAQELGIPPMQGLSQIAVVSGKPTLSAELMRALVQRAGHKIRVLELTNDQCVVEGERRDDPGRTQSWTFTMEDAKQAGLAGKPVWKQYPKAMLLGRATSALCRQTFADTLSGVSYVAEELGAEVNEDGEVLDAEPQVQDQTEPQEEVEPSAAEVVNDEDDPEHQTMIHKVEQLLSQFSEDDLAEQDGIRQYADESWEKAAVVYKRLTRLLEERDSEAEASVDLDEDDLRAVESIANGSEADAANDHASGASQTRPPAGERPARKSQVDLLKTLAVELRGEDGVARLEETVGKPLTELTRNEADEWISRLTPEEG